MGSIDNSVLKDRLCENNGIIKMLIYDFNIKF